MSGFVILMIAFALVSFADLVLMIKSFQHGKEKGVSLGFACLGALVVTLSYVVTLLIKEYFSFSLFSSVYFAGIDFSVVSLLVFTWYFTHGSEAPKLNFLMKLVFLYMIFDIAVLMVNPFWEITISYIPEEAEFASYSYQMHTLYNMHLIYTYLLVAAILFQLVRKVIRAPIIFGRQYLYCIIALLAVIGLNAIYLFLPKLLSKEAVDYSLLGYSVCALFFYWNGLDYASHGILNHFHSWIFENLDQALVLFSFDDKLILHNKKAEQIIPTEYLKEDTPLLDFLKGCGLRRGAETEGMHYSFQCIVDGHPVRCDYSVQLDKKQQRLGRLFVFSETSTQFDLLTGFRCWVDFKANADMLFPDPDDNLVVATCDINSLTDINRKYGRVTGDQAIQRLADEMRAQFPKGTTFTRSREASIAAICSEASVPKIKTAIRRVEDELRNPEILGFPIQIQSSVSVREEESVVDTIRRNLQAMRTKKLMDRSSVHSEMLRSLLQALEQCDSDTGAHVQRTQLSGEQLGRRIGLTDQQQSHLALLAIMHDIGKIGIPLEILNKPGKLTDAEWKMLKTHVQKGYQIAKSSQELSEIADMILYHHERWDGRGYPEGLREEQIPLLSRIISVVDAYDAMTNDRSYRKAIPETAARNELRRCSGTQFDPMIVREFLLMLEENDHKQGIILEDLSDAAQYTTEYGTAELERPQLQPEHRNVHVMASSIYYMDSNGRIIKTDPRFEVITGYTPEDVAEGKLTQSSLIFEEDQEEYFAQISEHGQSEDIYLEHRLRRKDGSAVYVYCYGHNYYDSAEGEPRTRVVIINSDDPFGE